MPLESKENTPVFPVIENKQIHHSKDCWGCGCCSFVNAFEQCFQSVIGRFVNIFPTSEQCLQSVIGGCVNIFPTSKFFKNGVVFMLDLQSSNLAQAKPSIAINGFGTNVFGNRMNDCFLNPTEIKSEQITYFVKQLIEAYKHHDNDKKPLEVFNELCEDDMPYVVYSASAGSFLALDCFLKTKSLTEKTVFFNEVVAKLFPDVAENERLDLQTKAQKLITNIVEKAILVNPPGVLFLADPYSRFSLKTQSLALGDRSLASEEYFINMISTYLSGSFELIPFIGSHCHHSDGVLKWRENKKHNGRSIYSSCSDEMAFPFLHVANFAKELQDKKIGDNKAISKYVYNIMQFGNRCEFDKVEEIFDANFKDFAEQKLDVVNIAKRYLQLRDEYLDLQSKYQKSRDLDKQKSFCQEAEALLNKFKIEQFERKCQIPNNQVSQPSSEIIHYDARRLYSI